MGNLQNTWLALHKTVKGNKDKWEAVHSQAGLEEMWQVIRTDLGWDPATIKKGCSKLGRFESTVDFGS